MSHIPNTIADAAASLRSGELTSVQLVTNAIERIKGCNAQWGAVISYAEEGALAAAEEADRELSSGNDRGPLHGIPVGLKDVLATADLPTTAQSNAMLDGFQGIDSAAAARLRESGAIVLAKATCSEFASGAPDTSKPFPLPRNPWDSARWAGGSSGGSASGLHAGFFLGAVGTDTGGSIRVPSAFSGVTGLKPTRGLISRYGCVPLSSTNDHIGPMARTAQDCAHLLSALAGADSRDEASVLEADLSIDFAHGLDGDLTGMVIGIDHAAHDAVKPPQEILDLFSAAITQLEASGAKIIDFSLPFVAEIHAAARITIACEAFDVHRENLEQRWEDYGAKTRLPLVAGAFFSGADYVRAQRILAKATQHYGQLLEQVDAVATITLPSVAPRMEEIHQLLATKVGALLTSRWNALGMPAVSVPMGMLPAEGAPHGLPVGLQIAGKPFADAQLLKISDAYQRRTSWHRIVSSAEKCKPGS
jgi:aspartyl-tRNA(Asn)/glutamyl-tRNA(Gln) amidotransferase subunit A